MGMNYYVKFKKRVVNQKDLHIGKKSVGWQFSFQAHEENEYYGIPELKSFKDYKKFLKQHKKEIVNECDEPVKYKDFIRMIKNSLKNKENLNHTDYVLNEFGERSCLGCDVFKDKKGYSFTYSDFS